MTIDLPSAAGGFGIASILLGWLATYVFATKADLAKVREDLAAAQRSQERALTLHDKDDRERNEAMVRRLFDKIDEMAKEIVAARLEIAGLPKYSRGQGVDLGGPKP